MARWMPLPASDAAPVTGEAGDHTPGAGAVGVGGVRGGLLEKNTGIDGNSMSEILKHHVKLLISISILE